MTFLKWFSIITCDLKVERTDTSKLTDEISVNANFAQMTPLQIDSDEEYILTLPYDEEEDIQRMKSIYQIYLDKYVTSDDDSTEKSIDMSLHPTHIPATSMNNDSTHTLGTWYTRFFCSSREY